MNLRVTRFGKDATADEVRALAPAPRAVEDDVRAIVEAVRHEGDAAVRRFTAEFDHAELAPDELRVPVKDIDEAVALLEPDVLRALREAIDNVRDVAESELELRESLSVELAPLTGMVDAIVDLSDTGTTLRENRLVELEELFVSTARLIANPVAHKLKVGAIDDLVARLRERS